MVRQLLLIAQRDNQVTAKPEMPDSQRGTWRGLRKIFRSVRFPLQNRPGGAVSIVLLKSGVSSGLVINSSPMSRYFCRNTLKRGPDGLVVPSFTCRSPMDDVDDCRR